MLAPADHPLSDEDDFHSWCARRSLIERDRSRPLWRLDIVPELPGGKLGVLLVLHHAVVHGLRGVKMITSLLDPTPDDRVNGVAWRPNRLLGGRRRTPFSPVATAAIGAYALRALFHASGGSAPSTSLTGPIGRHWQLTVLKYPIVELRAAAHAHGCTINDLLITAVTAGLRDPLSGRGECREGLELRASVPVGARGGKSEGGMFLARSPSASQTTPRASGSSRKQRPKARAAQIRGLLGSSRCPRAWRGWVWLGPSEPRPATSTCT